MKFILALALVLSANAAQAKVVYGWIIDGNKQYKCLSYMHYEETKVLAPLQLVNTSNCKKHFSYEFDTHLKPYCYAVNVRLQPIGSKSVSSEHCKHAIGWYATLLKGELKCSGYSLDSNLPNADLAAEKCASKYAVQKDWRGREFCYALNHRGVGIKKVETELCGHEIDPATTIAGNSARNSTPRAN
jgi:hypothetical protein